MSVIKWFLWTMYVWELQVNKTVFDKCWPCYVQYCRYICRYMYVWELQENKTAFEKCWACYVQYSRYICTHLTQNIITTNQTLSISWVWTISHAQNKSRWPLIFISGHISVQFSKWVDLIWKLPKVKLITPNVSNYTLLFT